MTTKIKTTRLNKISYLINIIVTLPVLVIGIAIGRSYEYVAYDDQKGVASIAQLISLVLAVIVVTWTIRRLHDIGKKGWYSFFLIPPFTVFFLIYLLVKSDQKTENKWGEHSESLRIFGIEANNIWRLLGIMAIVLFMTFLGMIFYGVLSSFK